MQLRTEVLLEGAGGRGGDVRNVVVIYKGLTDAYILRKVLKIKQTECFLNKQLLTVAGISVIVCEIIL